MQSSCRVFWAAAQASRPSCPTFSRHVHSSTRNSLLNPSSHSLSPTFRCALAAARDVHVQKRRRYSSDLGAPALASASTSTVPNEQAKQDVQGSRGSRALNADIEDIQLSNSTKHQSIVQKPERAAEKGAHRVLSTDSVADDDGRLKQPGQSDKPPRGAAGRGKNKRLELKDLAITKKKEPWQTQKYALKEKFGDAGWNPRKKLSPDTMEGIRTLHEQDPDRWSTPVLADHFKVSPEAIRRILKSKWRPSEKEIEKRRERWAKRHDRIWDKLAELGLRPQRTKEKPLEDPDEFEENLKAKEVLDNARNA